MIFKFVKKKIILDCFTYDEQIIQTAPITLATKQLPSWWKKLPSSYTRDGGFFPLPTMKNCAGMIDFYKHSVAFPLWSDLAISVNNGTYSWQFAHKDTIAKFHDINSDATGFLSNYAHLKLISPWVFQCKEDINWVWSQPTYNFDDQILDITVLPGIVNYSRLSNSHINIVFRANQQKNYMLSHGQVMVNLTPMSDRKVEVVRHLVTRAKFDEFAVLYKPNVFVKKYRKLLEKRNNFLDCPYHKEK